ncbi:hypothetical protein GGX14DRAFT_394957 [Mycena pura]|uniref:Uncharacterized protein n=1 Tax=Mycena pura TaxID=153505 RepID=A0AAD6VDX1_9AGAR|nr:hypothetical protein GGX14DRAFT_394957 [Mycena pura]
MVIIVRKYHESIILQVEHCQMWCTVHTQCSVIKQNSPYSPTGSPGFNSQHPKLNEVIVFFFAGAATQAGRTGKTSSDVVPYAVYSPCIDIHRPATTSHPACACARFRLRRKHLHRSLQPQPYNPSTIKNLLEEIAEVHWWIDAAQERPRHWLRSDAHHDRETAGDTTHVRHHSSVPLLRQPSPAPYSVPSLPLALEPALAAPGPLGLG